MMPKHSRARRRSVLVARQGWGGTVFGSMVMGVGRHQAQRLGDTKARLRQPEADGGGGTANSSSDCTNDVQTFQVLGLQKTRIGNTMLDWTRTVSS